MINNLILYFYKIMSFLESMEFHDVLVIFGISWVFAGLLVQAMTSNEKFKYDNDNDINNDDIDIDDDDIDNDNIDTDDANYDSDSTLVNTGSHVNSVQEFSEEENTIHYNTENENEL
jgi:hypothetical protein